MQGGAFVDMTLNESPSEKEGKFASPPVGQNLIRPSMKVPPKRKGNAAFGESSLQNIDPQ